MVSSVAMGATSRTAVSTRVPFVLFREAWSASMVNHAPNAARAFVIPAHNVYTAQDATDKSTATRVTA